MKKSLLSLHFFSKTSPFSLFLSLSLSSPYQKQNKNFSGCLKLVSLLKSVGAVRDEAARGAAPEPELSATLPPPRPSDEGGGGGRGGDSSSLPSPSSSASPLFFAQPRGPSGLPKARGVLRTLEACAAGLEGTAAAAGLSVSLSPPGRLLLPELLGRALGGHMRVEVALGGRALEALSKKKGGEEGEGEGEGEEAGGEKAASDAPPWWRQQPPPRAAAAAFPFRLSLDAARGCVSLRGWRVPTGLLLESPVAVEASLGDDLARALLARVHPFLASAVSVSAAGRGGGGGGARAKNAAAAAAVKPPSSSSSPLLPHHSQLLLPPPFRASLWPSGGHLPAESLDVVVEPLSLSLAPTGPAASLVAALGLGVVPLLSSPASSSASASGGGGARLRTGKLRATVYRGGRVRAKRLDVEIAAVARKNKKKKNKVVAKRSEADAAVGGDGDGDGDGDKARPPPPRPTSAFDAAAADPLGAAQAWFSSVLSGGGIGMGGIGGGGLEEGNDGGGDDDDNNGDSGSGSGSEKEGRPTPLRLALWGSADAGANDALDARVGIPVGALRRGGGGGVRTTTKEKKKKSGDGGGVESDSPASSSSSSEEEEEEDVVALRIVGPASNPAIDWASAARELPASAAAAAGERVRAAAAAAVASAAASRLGSAVGAPAWLTDAVSSAALLRQRRPSSVGGGGGGGTGEREAGEAAARRSSTKDAPSPAAAAARSLLSPFSGFSSSSSSAAAAAAAPSPLAAPPRDEPFDWEAGRGGGEGKSRSSPLRGRRLRFGG